MSTKKIRRRMKKTPNSERFPETAAEIRGLMESLGYSKQARLAEQLHVTQPMVSAWASGKEEPSAAFFFHLARLAKYPRSAWFLERAGIGEQAVLEAARGILDRRQISSDDLSERDVSLVPRFRFTLAGQESAGKDIPLPAEFISDRAQTVAYVIDEMKEPVADSPSATFVVDESRAGENPLPFWYEVVLMRNNGDTRLRGIYAGKLFALHHWPEHTGYPYHIDAYLLPLKDEWKQRSIHLGWWSPKSTGDLALQERGGYGPEAHDADERKGRDELQARGLVELKLETDWFIIGRVLVRLERKKQP